MKILYHHRTQGEGAEGVHIREVVKALRELGHNVEIVSPPGVDPFLSQTTESQKSKVIPTSSKSVRGSRDPDHINNVLGNVGESQNKISLKKRLIYALPQVCFEFLEIFYNVYATNKLKAAINAFKPNFIYERYSFFCKAGVTLSRQFNIPLILEVNEISGIKRQRPQAMKGLCQRFEKEIFQKASAIIVVSEFLKQEIIKRGIPADKIFVIPNAVNLEDFNLDASKGLVASDQGLPLGIQTPGPRPQTLSHDKITITFIGMFSHWDRLEFLIDSFKKIHDQAPQTHLVIVGEGLQRKKLQEQAEQLGLKEHITFTGKIERKEIPKRIAESDICVLSGSNPFGSPMAMFEYMVMGKPVVVPRYGPIENIVQDGINGVIFTPDNGEEFCLSVLDLVKNKFKRELLGKNARETILKNHLWEHNAKRIIKIYENISRS